MAVYGRMVRVAQQYTTSLVGRLALAVLVQRCTGCHLDPFFHILADDTKQLLKCVKSGSLKEVERLLRAGVDVNRRHSLGWTALHTAIVGGNVR